MPKFKDIKRRGVETFLQAVGASETTVDAVYTEEYDKFNVMVDDLNEIGAGLSEYLISLKQNYGLGNDLADVLDSYYNGEFNRPWISSNPNLSHLTMHQEVAKMKKAWQENDEIVRKSVAHVWINRGLTPMRAFVNTVTPDIEDACTLRENYRKDADSYRRRYGATQKKAQSAKTPEKKAEAQQEQAKLNVKLENANRLYETQNELVKGELEKAKIARDEAIEMMVITVAACQMELFEQSYKRMVSACSSFPPDKMKQVRSAVQNMIRTGGPNPGEVGSGASSAQTAVNLVTGKNTMGDLRKQREEQEQKEAAALAKAREVIMKDNANGGAVKTGGGWNKPSGGATSRGPPLPPKRVSATTELSNSLRSFNQPVAAPSVGRSGPPPPPSRSVPSSAAPPLPTKSAPPPLPTKKNAPPPLPSKRAPAQNTCTALYDNVPDDDDELAFSAGDKIVLIKKDDSGWWEGSVRGKSGTFPANFVTED
ncbi:hypothetical protein TrST_g717 [Triparma strigata]|uniref:SH3 domain-containing protein n=1 Tax=Triparma strigata TaxID=1606541 RepID=A0A9W7B589_9STRA|nr:hypothetical protein TrST_g717 [Triparma strigata]